MKKLVELIEIEKSFASKKKSLQKDYNVQSQEYVTRSKDKVTILKKEILNKNQIVEEKLSTYEKQSTDSKQPDIKLDIQKIKAIILSQLN
jgi:hypothetical protein